MDLASRKSRRYSWFVGFRSGSSVLNAFTSTSCSFLSWAMFSTSAISFVIAMIFSSMIGTSFLGKGYHLRGEIGRWGELNILFSMMEMSMLASTFPQILCPSSERANMLRIFQVCQRHCWRRPPHKAFVLRRGAPTWLRFSRSTSVIVGVDLPTKPLFFVRARQHG